MPTKKEQELVFNQTNRYGSWSLDSWKTDSPDYVQIMVDTIARATSFSGLTNNPILDNPNINTSVGSSACATVNLCVPSIHVPDITRKLVNDVYDVATGKPTDRDYQTADEVHKLASDIGKLYDVELRTSNPFKVGDIIPTNGIDIQSIGYVKNKAIKLDDIQDTDFAKIATIKEDLITNSSVNCRPETEYAIPPKPAPTDWKDKNYDDLFKKLEALLKDAVLPPKDVAIVANSDLTDRTVNGNGIFDWVATAILNQLTAVKNAGLINSGDIASVYTQSLVQGLQISAQYALERDKSYWANLLQQAQVQLAKVELLLAPSKLELAYAQLEVQRQQIELTKYQVEVSKLQIPQLAAQLDHTREQTALVCVQKKVTMEQLAQAELDRKLKQVQIETGVLNIKAASADVVTKEHQADQASLQTQLAVLQVEQSKEDTKIKNTQWQLGLKQLKAADANLKQLEAQLKLQAQQLLKDREQVALIKAQTATQYAQVTATSEAIKAAKAQYSDTIDGEPIGGVLGAQISVNKMQTECFDRASFHNFLTLAKDGWGVKKQTDMATLSPNVFNSFAIDRLFNYQANKYFNMPVDIFNAPLDYVDYLSDEAMDGKVSTPTTVNSRK